MKAIAVQDVWNHVTKQTILPGQEFELPEEQVLALIRIGAAKLPGDNEANPEPVNNTEVEAAIEPKIDKLDSKPDAAIAPETNNNTNTQSVITPEIIL